MENKITKEASVSAGSRQGGFTLFEVMVAVLLLAMVSSMMYSILNVSIKFSEKGEKKIVIMERRHALLSLLERQIKSAWYDDRLKQVVITAQDEVFRIVTRSPLLYPHAGTVLALYRYDPDVRVLYYTEKRDFYNIDYDNEFIPEYEDMMVLFDNAPLLTFSYPEDSSMVTISLDEETFEFRPWCQVASREDDIL